jgi:hypothetical protein
MSTLINQVKTIMKLTKASQPTAYRWLKGESFPNKKHRDLLKKLGLLKPDLTISVSPKNRGRK